MGGFRTRKMIASKWTTSRVCKVLGLWALAGALVGTCGAQTTSAPATAKSSNAGDVSGEVIEQMRGQMISPDASLPDIRKIKRYRTILRLGAEAERTHPGARNLHVVRDIMLGAARGMAILDGDDASRDALFHLARKISSSNAPPASTVLADVILTQAKLAEVEDDPARLGPAILAFVERYEKTDVAPGALMIAVTMALEYDQQRIMLNLASQLERYHNDVPGVTAFLRARLGRRPHRNRPFRAELTRLDGTTMRLPRDILGNMVLLHFWAASSPTSRAQLQELKSFYEEHREKGLEIVSISLDRSRRDVEAVVKEYGLEWPQIFSGRGVKDPTITRYGVVEVPSYWTISPDGRVLSEHGGRNPRIGRSMAEERAEHAQVIRFYLSGEFLLGGVLSGQATAAAGNGGIPEKMLEEIEACILPYLGVPEADKLKRYKELLELGAVAEREYPKAPGIALVRNWMMIAAGRLAFRKDGPVHRDRRIEIARRVLETDTPPELRLLGDFVVTSEELAQAAPRRDQAETSIRAFAERYAGTGAAVAAKMFSTLLAVETGYRELPSEFISTLRKVHREQPHVRGLLRSSLGQPTDRGLPFTAKLTRADGTVLNLPEDMKGKVVMLHFWSTKFPPGRLFPWERRSRRPVFPGLVPSEADGLVIIGVSLDNSREDFETYIKAHQTERATTSSAEVVFYRRHLGPPAQKTDLSGWVHTFSGKGWDDPTARKYDIHHLPSAWLIDRQGVLRYTNDGRYHYGTSTLQKEMKEALARGRGRSTPQPEPRNVKVALQWHVIGPFQVGAAAKARSARLRSQEDPNLPATRPAAVKAFPVPGERVDLQAVYEGKGGMVAKWQTLRAQSGGTVYLERPYDRVSFAEACAKTYLHSATGGTYEVALGGSDFMAVYVNGSQAYTSVGADVPRYSHSRFKTEIGLEKGWNQIDLTAGHMRSRWSFYLRFTDPDDTLKFATEPN